MPAHLLHPGAASHLDLILAMVALGPCDGYDFPLDITEARRQEVGGVVVLLLELR